MTEPVEPNPVIEVYRTRINTLADDTDHAAQTVLLAYLVAKRSRDDAALAIAALINKANAKATSLADYYLAQQVAAAARQPVPTVGLVPVDDSDRLVKAAHTTLSAIDKAVETADPATDTPSGRLTRLTRSGPLETAQAATSEAIKRQRLVEGWVRELHQGACEMCVWWWREGRVWPKEHPLQSHKGCQCSQRVVLAKSIKAVGVRNGRRVSRTN